MKIFDQLDSQRQRSLFSLFIAGLLFWSSTTTLLPTLPIYVKEVGGTDQQIGLVMGAFAIGLLSTRVWLGKMADQRGRKIVIWIGIGVAAAAPLGYLAVRSIPLLMALRAFHGISVAALTTGYSALVADLAPENRRGELIGYMGLVAPIGMALGPAIGGFIQEAGGNTPLFLASASLGILSMICSSQVWDPYNPQERLENHSSQPLPKPSLFKIFWSPHIRTLALVMLMVGLIFGSLVTFLPLFVKNSQIATHAGWFYTTAAITSFCLRIPTGRASDRYGRGLFITLGLICYGFSMILLQSANSNLIFLFAAVLEGGGAGLVFPMVITLIADRSLPQERGLFFSLCTGGFDLGIAISGPIFGSVSQFIGYRNLFSLNAGLAGLALLIFFTLSSKNIPYSIRFALGRGKDIYALDQKL